MKPEYLGDGVYIKFNGDALEILANHQLYPSDTIFLEQNVFINLIKYGIEAFAINKDIISKIVNKPGEL